MYYKNIKMYWKPAKSTGQKVVGDKNLFPKAVVFILVFLSFLIFSFFIKTSDAKAATSSGSCNMYTATGPSDKLVWPKYPLPIGDAKDAAACQKMCPKAAHIRCEFVGGTTPGAELAKSVTQQKKDDIQKAIDSTKGGGCSIWNLDICLLKPVMWIAKLLLLMAASLFGWIVDVKNFHYVVNNNGAIQQAWTLIRDILNMVFILVLLFSAFCTIFQVSKYNYKKILLTLVIMALLVNFSFPISRIIIDASNVMMYSIIKTQIPSTSNFFLQVTQNAQIGVLLNSNSYTSGGMMLAGIIFIFILSITLLAVALLFVIRMIALAILIIFSPIGFVGHIMPGFEKYASQWWDNLFRYAFFGPIMMLGLYVAIHVMTATISIDTVPIMLDAAKKTSTNIAPGLLGAMAFSLIPVVILWMTMGLAQSMSIAGASTIMGGAKKALKWSGKNLSGYNLAKTGVKAGIHKFDRDILAKKFGISPKTIKEAWKQKSAEKDQKVYTVATGKWRDNLNSMFSLGKEKTNFEKAALQGNIAKKQKELSETSETSEYLSSELENAVKAKDSQKAAAIIRILYGNNDQNEMIKQLTNERKVLYGLVDEKSGKPLENFHVNTENKAKMIKNILTKSGMDEQNTYKQMSDLGEIAFQKGNYADFAMAGFNVKSGAYEKNDPEKQMAYAIGKASNVKAQTKTDMWHWNSFLEEESDGQGGGKIGNMHDFGKLQLAKMTGSEVGQMNRVRRDFAQKLAPRTSQMKEYAEKLETDSAEAMRVFKDELPENATAEQALERGKLQAGLIRQFIASLNEKAYGVKEKTPSQAQTPKTNQATAAPEMAQSTIIDPRTQRPVVIDPSTGQPFK